MGGGSKSRVKVVDAFLSFLKTKKGIALIVAIVLGIWFWCCLPSPLFSEPTSTVLEDHSGTLLSARIASDGQWRFPITKHVPQKFMESIVQFEDKQFYKHPGINPFSLARATIQNLKAKKVKSGGSTLSMQVIRLMRKEKKRTFLEKIIEIILALRLELSYSKSEILALYASYAPFGGNVIGIDAASWRYYGRDPEKLSWSEAATLAVLPNAPSLIYPGKNQLLLRAKRDRLLNKLCAAHLIDKTTCELSKKENLPEKPHTIPQLAPHLLQRAITEGWEGKRIQSTLDEHLQDRVNEILENYHKIFRANEIQNACALVMEVNSGNVLAYVGNTTKDGPEDYDNDVDVISAPRSTGSILKPFLFASMLNDGEILPNTLIPDIPTQIAGYVPHNYNVTFDGAVPAKKALARSLNIPAVRMLQNYGTEKFNYNLKKLGMTTLRFAPDHYGLSVILGGAEGKIWDLAAMYANMARTLNHYTLYNGFYNKNDFHPPYYTNQPEQTEQLEKSHVLSAASIYLTFQAMVEVSRPDEDVSWKRYTSSTKVAWKTGTSFGFRDGWAIGVTPKHVVAVWVGNADGEGRPGLTGIQTAAPVLFSIFSLLKSNKWFLPPFDEMKKEVICKQSGCRASDICEPLDTTWIQATGLRSEACKYHRMIHLDPSGKYRVNSNCEDVSTMQHVSWFILPPAIEWYYKFKNPHYKDLPPLRNDCETNGMHVMEIIYPKQFSKIYVPVELNGNMGKTIFQVAHRDYSEQVYWHLDGKYLGTTKTTHQMALAPDEGTHQLTLVDTQGETISIQFEIISKKK